jgi:50S ribosomal subunit-associated GTPase HflX
LPPEAAAQDLRAQPSVASADLFPVVIDARREDAASLPTNGNLFLRGPSSRIAIVAWNKVDPPRGGRDPAGVLGEDEWVAVSARTGAGCDELARRVQARLGSSGAVSGSPSADAGSRRSSPSAIAER